MSRQKNHADAASDQVAAQKARKNALIMQQRIRQPSFSNISTPVNKA